MKLFHVSQTINNGHHIYSDFVVCCGTREEAQETCPHQSFKWHDGSWYYQYDDGREEPTSEVYSWCQPQDATVNEIGEANPDIPRGIVCKSFHDR